MNPLRRALLTALILAPVGQRCIELGRYRFDVGFLDRAKKLAEQALEKAEDALAEAKSRAQETSAGSGGETSATSAASATSADPRMGTPYVPGMLGRPGWRERGLADPAAVLPIAERDRAGIPHSVKSRVVEEPFGMGRRWSADGRSAALFYQLYPEHLAWEPAGERTPVAGVGGASQATLADGRSLVFLGDGDRRVVLETDGIDDSARSDLVNAVVARLASD